MAVPYFGPGAGTRLGDILEEIAPPPPTPTPTQPQPSAPAAPSAPSQPSSSGASYVPPVIERMLESKSPKVQELGKHFLQRLRKAQGVIIPETQMSSIGKPAPIKKVKRTLPDIDVFMKQQILQREINTGISPADAFKESKKTRYTPFINPMEEATKQLMIKKSSQMTVNQFRNKYPDITLPVGEYDVVNVNIPMRNESGMLTKGFEFSYSDVAKHKIAIGGGVDNYNKYLNIVRSRPELVAIYNLSGGKGVGPLGIVPTMGVDLAAASNKPGITGASEREEVLITYLHRTKGSPEGGPTLGGMGMAIIESPYVALTAGEAATVLVSAGAKGLVRVTPRVLARLPGLQKPVSRLISATTRIGGPAKMDFFKTTVGRNFLRWAKEGAMPVVKTTPVVVSSKEASRQLFKKGLATVDDFGNIVLKKTSQPIGYIDDFNRVILYKPQRYMGLAERKFISPERAKHFADLLKQKTAKEGTIIARGTRGKDPWVEFQVFLEKSGYKKGLRGVKHPYTSKKFKIRLSEYPKYTPEEAFLSESEALQQAILKGRVPGRQYTSLYNVQQQAYREFTQEFPELAKRLGPEFLKSQKLPGYVTVATKKDVIAKMKNIWAGKRWNPFTQTWDDVATGSLLKQPTQRLISQEEREIVKQISKGATVVGKGKGAGSLRPQFLIPVQRTGLESFILSFLGFRPMIDRRTDISKVAETRRDVFSIPKSKQQQKVIQATRIRQKQILETMRGELPIQDQMVEQQQFLEQMQKMGQAEELFMFAPTIFEEPPPRSIRKPPAKIPGEAIGYPPGAFPFWFPGMGGKFAGRGFTDEAVFRYWNELAATKALVRDVIL